MPDVYITAPAWASLWAYVTSIETEIGGMGYAYLEGNAVVVKDVFTMPQVASHGGVDFDEFGGDEYAINKAAEDGFLGGDNSVWFSWHSHNTMKAFWSSTDDTRIEKLRDAGIPLLLSFVGNHKFEYKMRLDYFEVEHKGLIIPQITQDDLKLYLDPHDPTFDAVLQDMKDNLKKKPNPPKASNTQGGHTAATSAANTRKNDPGDKVVEAFEIKSIMDELEVSYKWAKMLHEEGISNDQVEEMKQLMEELDLDVKTCWEILEVGWKAEHFANIGDDEDDVGDDDSGIADAILQGAH